MKQLICLTLFNKIGVDVQEYDIDIAHRVQTRIQQHGRQRQQPRCKPIICKFVRRAVRERVLAARRNTNCLEPEDFGLAPEDLGYISILSHLPPKLQELLGKAKTFQSDNDFKFCWAKTSAIFLHKTENSRVYRLESKRYGKQCTRIF